MNQKIIIGLIVFTLLGLYLIYLNNRLYLIEYEHFQMRESMINNSFYEVQDYPDPDGAANLLAHINKNIKGIIQCLISKYPNEPRVKRLRERASSLRIEEAIHEPDSSTFTINKGESMSICLRKKNARKEFYQMDLLLFVIIHELAHIMTISEGHTPEFMMNFKFILKEAASCGLYVPVDYSQGNNKIDYCGVMVTHNPYFE
jgi:predicted metal-dependent hydrolase